MDLRDKKRINIVCPKCKYQYSFSGNALFQQKRFLTEQLSITKAKMRAFCEEHPNKKERDINPYYKKLIRIEAEQTAQLQKAKTEVANASNIAELDLFIAFKKKLFQIYGKEEMIKILKECEEEMVYFDYELAIQDHTNFNGA